MGHLKADEALMAAKMYTADLDLPKGRNISVYYRLDRKPKARLEIFDIPTILRTSLRVIERVTEFWGAAEPDFKDHLEDREIVSFRRTLSDIIKKEQDMSEDCVKVLNPDEFDKAIKVE